MIIFGTFYTASSILSAGRCIGKWKTNKETKQSKNQNPPSLHWSSSSVGRMVSAVRRRGSGSSGNPEGFLSHRRIWVRGRWSELSLGAAAFVHNRTLNKTCWKSSEWHPHAHVDPNADSWPQFVSKRDSLSPGLSYSLSGKRPHRAEEVWFFLEFSGMVFLWTACPHFCCSSKHFSQPGDLVSRLFPCLCFRYMSTS